MDYTGASWGNHFDYQSRVFFLPKGVPTVVWVSLIGHAFLDAFEYSQENRYLDMAVSACNHIVKDYQTSQKGEDLCISYIPTENKQVHNANVLGAGFLARTFALNQKEEYKALAKKAINYTIRHQRPDHSWYYGEAKNLRWVDNFHTAYVLDSLKHFIQSTGEKKHMKKMMLGYEHWKKTFFLEDGTPKYYDQKVKPLDIQCSSQAIDTLVFFRDLDATSLQLAKKVANWTIDNFQDRSGFFYYRKYGKWITNKTPTLHWGQATMLCALSGLYQALAQAGSKTNGGKSQAKLR
jgi:uncharacterized protein YyaL (SSP411 family)